MKKNLMVLSGSVLGFAPVVAFAQGASAQCAANSATIGNIICIVGRTLNSIIPIIILLGVVYFIWGVVTFVIASDEEAKAAGKNRIIYGIIGLAVIVAMWGLVNILVNTFGISTTGITTFPGVVIPQ
ncbi:MAG: hypothetical protein WCP17_00115 [bacterium]